MFQSRFNTRFVSVKYETVEIVVSGHRQIGQFANEGPKFNNIRMDKVQPPGVYRIDDVVKPSLAKCLINCWMRQMVFLHLRYRGADCSFVVRLRLLAVQMTSI